MIEGLWIAKFLTPDDPDMELSGGAVVIESNRVLGGDSGYFYVGDVAPTLNGSWDIKLTISRHDPTIESVFGDNDRVELQGTMTRNGADSQNRPLLFVSLKEEASQIEMTAALWKVAELP